MRQGHVGRRAREAESGKGRGTWVAPESEARPAPATILATMPADHKPKPGYSRFWPLPTSSERPLGAKSQRTSTLRRDFDSLSPSSEAPVSSAHSRTSDRKTLSRRPSSSRVAKSLRLTRSGANEPPRELKFMNGHVLCMDGRVISRFFATPEELKCARRLPVRITASYPRVNH
jgi:hypothetical protein